MADFGQEFLVLIRHLEPRGYDMANLHDDLRGWYSRQSRLFQELQILQQVPGTSEEDQPERQTCTWTIVRNAMMCKPLCVGPKVFHLWSKERGDHEDLKAACTSMSNTIEGSRTRMEAEFNGTLQMDFAAFSFRRWHRYKQQDLSQRKIFEAETKLKLQRLFRAANCCPRDGCKQFFEVVHILYEEYKVSKDKQLPGQYPDNRALWRRCFQEDVNNQANIEGDISVLRWGLITLGCFIIFYPASLLLGATGWCYDSSEYPIEL